MNSQLPPAERPVAPRHSASPAARADASVPPPPKAPASGDDAELFALFLRDHDCPCPACRYNLRGLTRGMCPECGHVLRLGIDVRQMRFGPFLSFLAPFMVMLQYPVSLVLLIVVCGPTAVRAVFATLSTVDLTYMAAGWVDVLLLAVLYSQRHWFLRRRPPVQWLLVVTNWLVHLALMGLYVKDQWTF